MNFDLDSTIDLFGAIVPIAATVAAAISAASAYHANRSIAKADRKRCVREVFLLARRVEAAVMDVHEIGDDLKSAYLNQFIFAGQGPGSSRLHALTDEIEKKRDAVMPIQQTARKLIDGGAKKLTDEQITKRLLEFDGYLVLINRICSRFHADLRSAESQNLIYRQEAIKGP